MKAQILKLWRSATQRVMSLTFLGLLVNLALDVLIAARLGAGQTADALIIALSMPLLVDTVTRESAKFSLVPIFVEYRTERPAAYSGFISGLINASLVGGVLMTAASAAGAPWIVRLLGPGMTPEGAAQATRLLWACAPILLFAPLVTVQGVVLNSEERFSRVALRNATAPGLVVLTLLAAWERADVAVWIAGAYSAGFALYAAFLVDGLRRSSHFNYAWSAWPSSADWKKVGEALSWPSLGFAVRQTMRLLERAIASLVTVGGVSAYYFAFRIFSGLQTLIGTSVATTGLPNLSAHHAAAQQREARAIVRSQIRRVVLLALPAAAGALLFSETIIELVYRHGAFGADDLQRTERLLFWFGPGILFVCLTPPLNAVLYSMKQYRLVFWNMLAMAVLNVTLAWGLAVAGGLGLSGIAISVSITALCSACVIPFLIRRAGLPLWGPLTPNVHNG